MRLFVAGSDDQLVLENNLSTLGIVVLAWEKKVFQKSIRWCSRGNFWQFCAIFKNTEKNTEEEKLILLSFKMDLVNIIDSHLSSKMIGSAGPLKKFSNGLLRQFPSIP